MVRVASDTLYSRSPFKEVEYNRGKDSSYAPSRRYHDLWPVREHQNIKNLDDLVGSLTIAPISTAHGIFILFG